KRAAWPSRSSSAFESPSSRPMATASSCTRRERPGGDAPRGSAVPASRAGAEAQLLHTAGVAGGVRAARVHRRRERLHRGGRALAQKTVRLLERHVLRLGRLGGLAG